MRRTSSRIYTRVTTTFVTLQCFLLGMFLVLCLSGGYAFAAPSLPPGFQFETYISGLSRPVDLQWLPDGRLFIAEKKGKVRVVDNDILLATPFIDISDEVNSNADRGLLGIAVHPAFPATPWVYLLFTHDPPEALGLSGTAGPDGKGQRVARLIRVTADSASNYATAIAGSEVALLGSASTWNNIGDPTAEQVDLSAPWSCGPDGAYVEDCVPAEGRSHSIGTVRFGADGSLYVGIGDATTWTTVAPSALRSLSVDSLAGKILRIDAVTGEGLSDNPYWNGSATTNRSKVWYLGLRNPYRFQIDPVTDEVWVGDVGWGDWEELNHGAPGADFGWPCYEGDDTGSLEQPGYSSLIECQNYYGSANAIAPVYSYEHVSGLGGSLLTGDYYTHNKWPSEFHNKLFIADYALETISYTDTSGGALQVIPFASNLVTVDLVLGPDGDLYSADVVTETVGRIVFRTGGPDVLNIRVNSSADDAEESESGGVSLTSSDLEMTFDGTTQQVGMRFNNVNVEQGTTFDEAYIQFTTDEVSTSTTSLSIQAEAVDDAAIFTSTNSDLSSRTRLAASVSWNPEPWNVIGETGTTQRTPDLSALVEEVVARPGWLAGNSIVFLVTGTGKRVAESYNGEQDLAPLLHLSVNTSGGSPPQVSISQPVDGIHVNEGDNLQLVASAIDLEDDDVTLTEFIQWTSDLAGNLGAGSSVTTNILAEGIHQVTASVEDSDGLLGLDSVTVNVDPPTNSRPTASIDAPGTGAFWAVGDEVQFSGSANDPEDGMLGEESLTWSVEIIHNEHTHVDFLTVSGAAGQFSYPDHDDNSHLRLCLTASDSGAQTDTVCIDLLPRLINYTFDSDPSGLNLIYNGQSAATPFSMLVHEGSSRLIAAPSPQGAFVFDQWSIGGPAAQQILIGATDSNLIATYNSAPSVTIDTPVNNAVFDTNNSIQFSSTATDAESGNIGADVTWNSSLDGGFSETGHTVNQILSEGIHVITAQVVDVEGLSANNKIIIYVTPGGGVLEISDIQVINGDDDAEESTTGKVNMTSSDLEMVFDETDQTVAMRFVGVAIEPGAVITKGWIQFTADESTSVATSLSIGGEKVANAQPFLAQDFNLSDRQVTTEQIAWSPAPWSVGEAGSNQRTPNLAPVLNEIINVPGWVKGNALSIIVTGVGERVAESYSGDTSAAPILHLEFVNPPGGNTSPNVTISAPNDGANFTEGDDVMFSAQADDFEDGDLSSQIDWSSDVDGALGSGNSINVANLSVAVHNITASVTDSGNKVGQASISITVAAGSIPNQSPVANDDSVNTNEGVQVNINVVNNDTDSDNNLNPASTNTGCDTCFSTSNGALQNNGDGTFTYTPMAGFIGDDSFVYQVCDTEPLCDDATVSVSVNNSAPSVTIDTPVNDAIFDTNNSIEFSSTATDAEGEDIGTSVTWNSSLDGGFSETGSTVNQVLSAGMHVITAQVVYGEGLSANNKILIYVTPSGGVLETSDIQVINGDDDAEESTTGKVKMSSSDLEMVLEKTDQTVGMRFVGVAIKPGAVITSAWVQFAADETTAVATSLSIGGEKVANAQPFLGQDFNLSSRPVTEQQIPWSPAAWAAGEAGANQRTPNLAPVLNEIINVAGWEKNNPFLIIVTGEGKRVAESHNGDPSAAPILHVEFVNPPGSNMSPNVTISAPSDGANFTEGDDVTFSGLADDDEDGDLSAQIDWTSDVDGALGSGNSFSVANLSVAVHEITASVTDSGNKVGQASISITVTAGSIPNQSPVANDDSVNTNEATQVNINVVDNDTDPDNNLDPASATICDTCSSTSNGSLVNNGDGTFTYTPTAGFIGDDSFVYQVCDTESLCDEATVTVMVTAVSGGTLVEVRVANSDDDAEQKETTGKMYLDSTDLELVDDTNSDIEQVVGIRFAGVAVPPGATINTAVVQFQADETGSDPVDLTIAAEASDNAPAFTATRYDISSRPTTTTFVSWSPAPWNLVGEAGAAQQTEDLASLIQEIVDRPGWQSNNAIVLIVTGTGKRTGESFDGESASAALLSITYN